MSARASGCPRTRCPPRPLRPAVGARRRASRGWNAHPFAQTSSTIPAQQPRISHPVQSAAGTLDSSACDMAAAIAGAAAAPRPRAAASTEATPRAAARCGWWRSPPPAAKLAAGGRARPVDRHGGARILLGSGRISVAITPELCRHGELRSDRRAVLALLGCGWVRRPARRARSSRRATRRACCRNCAATSAARTSVAPCRGLEARRAVAQCKNRHGSVEGRHPRLPHVHRVAAALGTLL